MKHFLAVLARGEVSGGSHSQSIERAAGVWLVGVWKRETGFGGGWLA
jgi:hypothetical protein